MSWYYVESGHQAGPLEQAQFEELVRTGRVRADTLVWCEGMPDWRPYGELAPAAPPVMAEPGSAPPITAAAHEAVCVECGRVFDKEEMIEYGGAHVCAACKPVFMQKLAEGARVRLGGPRYAGFWIRAAAKMLDGILLAIVFMPPLFYFALKNAPAAGSGTVNVRFQVLQLLFQLLYLVGNMGYTIFFLGKYGATPGKMVCSLQVRPAEGGRLSYGRATGRFFAEMLSGITCYIGYIIAGFDEEKRALHDHICNTRVVYR